MTWAKGSCMSMHTGQAKDCKSTNMHTHHMPTCTRTDIPYTHTLPKVTMFHATMSCQMIQNDIEVSWSIMMEIACQKWYWYRTHNTLHYTLHSIALSCVTLHLNTSEYISYIYADIIYIYIYMCVCVHRPTDRQTDRQTDGQTDGRTDRQTDRQIDR